MAHAPSQTPPVGVFDGLGDLASSVLEIPVSDGLSIELNRTNAISDPTGMGAEQNAVVNTTHSLQLGISHPNDLYGFEYNYSLSLQKKPFLTRWTFAPRAAVCVGEFGYSASKLGVRGMVRVTEPNGPNPANDFATVESHYEGADSVGSVRIESPTEPSGHVVTASFMQRIAPQFDAGVEIMGHSENKTAHLSVGGRYMNPEKRFQLTARRGTRDDENSIALAAHSKVNDSLSVASDFAYHPVAGGSDFRIGWRYDVNYLPPVSLPPASFQGMVTSAGDLQSRVEFPLNPMMSLSLGVLSQLPNRKSKFAAAIKWFMD